MKKNDVFDKYSVPVWRKDQIASSAPDIPNWGFVSLGHLGAQMGGKSPSWVLSTFWGLSKNASANAGPDCVYQLSKVGVVYVPAGWAKDALWAFHCGVRMISVLYEEGSYNDEVPANLWNMIPGDGGVATVAYGYNSYGVPVECVAEVVDPVVH